MEHTASFPQNLTQNPLFADFDFGDSKAKRHSLIHICTKAECCNQCSFISRNAEEGWML